MAFWGIEVKPGKPYTYSFDSARGRLRISQATLGNGKSTSLSNKIVLQCNVGNKSPILLCKLIPDKYESCQLDLEFEEAEDVIFSVIGQSSIHLSGYYIGISGCNHDGDETDSYGEDIAESDTSGSYSSSEGEDEYDSDFIDDADIKMFSSSPRSKSGVVIEEIIEDEKPTNENASGRRLKKKHQMSDSDGADDSKRKMVVRRNNSIVLESEDEDGFPVTFSSKSKNVVEGSEGNSKSKPDEKATDDKKRKIDDISQDVKSKSEDQQLPDTVPCETGEETNEKSKKKKTKKEKKEGTTVEPHQDEVNKEGFENGVKSGEENVEPKSEGTDNDGKAKKKKKKSKKGKTTRTGVDASAEKTEDEAVKDVNEAANNDEMDQDPLVNGEQELLTKSEVADNSVSPATNETNGKLKTKNKKKRAKADMGLDAGFGEAADVNQTDTEKSKKESKKKNQGIISAEEMGDEMKPERKKSGLNTRTFSNGLVVEELSMGKPDGKRATPGKKVSVNYIGKLLKNGKIFDSNVGKRPYEFRLGVSDVIKAWDVGLKGMRVGDKRRLTVPPCYGYEDKKVGPIPPNSWLLFDVELVNVR